MSLSTQLARGALALPMLLGFASLHQVASQRADVGLLAQAPADLGNLAIRWSHSCRG